MKGEKAKYLIIDATKINKQLYKVTREFAFNDFDNIYEPNGAIDASQIFEKNGIPKGFQKIIVKINIPFCLKKEAEEYISGFPFDITSGKIEKVNNKRIITVSNCPIYDYHANKTFRDKIKFRTELTYSTYEDIYEFLLDIDREGYLIEYLQSLKEFFDISLNLDLLLDSWDGSLKEPKKALKLYKKTLSTK